MNCNTSGCNQVATAHFTVIERRRCKCHLDFCDEHGRIYWKSIETRPATISQSPLSTCDAAVFDFDVLVHDENSGDCWIWLQELGGQRRVHLKCGVFELYSLDWKIRQIRTPRPLTHDAMASVITALQARLQDVLIDKIEREKDNTFHAKLRLIRNGDELLIDVRPSDAFVLAAIFEIPILVKNEIVSWANNNLPERR